MVPHDTIYSLFANVSPRYEITEIPVNLVYLLVTSESINSITVWLTDQNGKGLSWQEKNLFIRFHM